MGVAKAGRPSLSFYRKLVTLDLRASNLAGNALFVSVAPGMAFPVSEGRDQRGLKQVGGDVVSLPAGR